MRQWSGVTSLFATLAGTGQALFGGGTAPVPAPPGLGFKRPGRLPFVRSRTEGHVIQTTCRRDLARIREGDKNLAIWNRMLPPPVIHWLDMLPREKFPKKRIVTAPRFARDKIGRAFLQSGISASPEAEFLLDDLSELTALFCDIAKTRLVDIKLDSIGHDACHKFHVDYVTLRLLMTYCGAGTEWLQNEYADMVRKSGLEPRDDIVHQVPRFAVGLFKGSADRTSNVPAILHRSPAVPNKRATRFFVCMDTDP